MRRFLPTRTAPGTAARRRAPRAAPGARLSGTWLSFPVRARKKADALWRAFPGEAPLLRRQTHFVSPRPAEMGGAGNGGFSLPVCAARETPGRRRFSDKTERSFPPRNVFASGLRADQSRAEPRHSVRPAPRGRPHPERSYQMAEFLGDFGARVLVSLAIAGIVYLIAKKLL